MMKIAIYLAVLFTLGLGFSVNLWAEVPVSPQQAAPQNSGAFDANPIKINSSGSRTDGWIANRADLDALLGSGATTDDFETFDVADGTPNSTDVNYMDETTIVDGQGPGLVNDGASYDAGGGVLQWNGKDYFGLPDKTILSNTNEVHTIDYDTPVEAMGIDLHAFSGSPHDAQVEIFDANGAFVDSLIVSLPTDASAVFVGYEFAAGIGSVVLFSQTVPWSPVMNDHTYGNMGAGSEPVPDIKANGQDNAVTVNYGSNLTVDISLDPGDEFGNNADWWVLADSPFSWYRYSLMSGLWVPGLAVTYQGTLNPIGPFTVFNGTGLPIGTYIFYFGVDMNMNGALDIGQLYSDSVTVIVQ